MGFIEDDLFSKTGTASCINIPLLLDWTLQVNSRIKFLSDIIAYPFLSNGAIPVAVFVTKDACLVFCLQIEHK